MTKVIEFSKRKSLNSLSSFEKSYEVKCSQENKTTIEQIINSEDIDVLRRYRKLCEENIGKARKLLEDYICSHNAGPSVYRELGYLYTYLGNDDKVIEYFERVLNQIPHDYKSLYELKEYFFRQCMRNKEYSKKAEKYLYKFLATDITDAETYFQLYKVLYNKNPEKSIMNLKLARKFAYADIENSKNIINDIDISLFEIYFENEKYNKVIEIIECIHNRGFKNFDTCYRLGQCYNHNKDFSKAEQYYLDAIEINQNRCPLDIQFILDLGYLYMDTEKYHQALECFTVAFHRIPEDLDFIKQMIAREINDIENMIEISKKIKKKPILKILEP